MKTFIQLTVAFTKDKTRIELINVNKIYRILEQPNGAVICFNSTGSDYIEVKEKKEDIEKMLG